MGLRHLPVVSHDGDVIGTITRKDLIIKHEELEEGHASLVDSHISESFLPGQGRVTTASGEQHNPNRLNVPRVAPRSFGDASVRRHSLVAGAPLLADSQSSDHTDISP